MSKMINNAKLYRALLLEGLGDVLLYKGKGFFYITSNDPKMAERITKLETNVIYCNSFCQQPIQDWVRDIKLLLTED